MAFTSLGILALSMFCLFGQPVTSFSFWESDSAEPGATNVVPFLKGQEIISSAFNNLVRNAGLKSEESWFAEAERLCDAVIFLLRASYKKNEEEALLFWKRNLRQIWEDKSAKNLERNRRKEKLLQEVARKTSLLVASSKEEWIDSALELTKKEVKDLDMETFEDFKHATGWKSWEDYRILLCFKWSKLHLEKIQMAAKIQNNEWRLGRLSSKEWEGNRMRDVEKKAELLFSCSVEVQGLRKSEWIENAEQELRKSIMEWKDLESVWHLGFPLFKAASAENATTIANFFGAILFPRTFLHCSDHIHRADLWMSLVLDVAVIVAYLKILKQREEYLWNFLSHVMYCFAGTVFFTILLAISPAYLGGYVFLFEIVCFLGFNVLIIINKD